MGCAVMQRIDRTNSKYMYLDIETAVIDKVNEIVDWINNQKAK